MPTVNTTVNYFCNLLSESQIAFLLSAFLMMVDTSQGKENTDVFYLDLAAGLGSFYIQEQQEQKIYIFCFYNVKMQIHSRKVGTTDHE